MALGDFDLLGGGEAIPYLPDQAQTVFGAHPVDPQVLDSW
jgi:hypothetical protein